ncbi:hypothetical protein [Tunturiibacter gelidiferens]|uniref:hypothetical protein n=1 Tax=Tunturiibacter gelidiferens TaxID=3069689 RepID=UPI003D9BC965
MRRPIETTVDFGKLLDIYVVLFFLVAQIMAKLQFHQSPTKPIYLGGAFVVVGGFDHDFLETLISFLYRLSGWSRNSTT